MRKALIRVARVVVVWAGLAALGSAQSDQTPDLVSALETTGASFVQNALGFTGKGVRIAIIDTGVDYHHPDLGGCFGPGCKVVGGYDFVGDEYTGSASTPMPDPDPDDCNGHGTHVAGIAAANAASPSGVTGVAPDAEILAYRVFGCDGSGSTDIIVAAMERAVAEGADVVNMSLGTDLSWTNTLHALAAAQLLDTGVVIVASIGNSGAIGTYAAGAPGIGADVIGVASYENEEITLPVFTVSPDDTPAGYQRANGAPAPPTGGTFPIARTGTPTSTADACEPLPPGSLSGMVALVRRGTCGFYNKARNAELAGAVAVVLYNNAAGRLIPTVAPPTPSDPAVTIPVVLVSAAEGELIDSRLAAGPVSITWTDTYGTFPNAPLGGLLASTSSYGPPPDLSLKPDIGAPGGNIRSTWPLDLGAYNIISGTSMASPHVAGAAALLLEARPGISRQELKTRLMNSADPRPWSGNPTLGLLDVVHRQGAGMLDVSGAAQATTLVTPDSLALGEIESGSAVRTLTIRNVGPEGVTYTLSHIAGLATRGTFPVAGGLSFFNAPATVVFSAGSITVPAGGTGTVEVTITPLASLPNTSLFGGYLVLTSSTGGASYSVPFTGLKGDYQSIPVLTTSPLLGRFDGSTCVTSEVEPVYTMAANDQPCIVAHFDHPSSRALLYLTAVDGKLLARAIEFNYARRNQTATGEYVFIWDGVGYRGSGPYVAPNGDYKLQLQILKALGSPDEEAHTEKWTSPTITIARP